MKFSYEVSRYKLIYVFGIADDAHKGLLKIGEATISTDLPAKKLFPNCKELNAAADERIKSYTNTAGIAYKLLHTELAIDDGNFSFGDRDIHRLLKRSGIKKISPPGTTAREWFRLPVKIAIRAIKAVKQGKKFLTGLQAKNFVEEFIPRPEQDDAINKTVKYFQRGKEFLWNAKMRFGKTICALEVVRQMKFSKTIIVTHRPVVKAGWFEDFDKIFHGTDYVCRHKDNTITGGEENFIYFASMQDLRGSKKVGGKYDKNDEIFSTQWDCVIVDEAHEGTQTALGDSVIKKLVKKKTKFLALSGTPFNLLEKFSADSVYTWDYVNEQQAKKFWDAEHFGEHNPYAELPQMNIYTYDLGKLLGKKFSGDDDIIFSFSEFFRTNDAGNFVHEADIKSFLNLLVKQDDNNYPFSRPEFCDMFRHTLWIVPGVKAGQALSKLLKDHRVFCNFEVANVAGDGDEDIPYKDALELVKKTIAENDYTITISCGKLTAGVTVPQWTAVLYLAGSYFTSATNYLQTIFRVQTPCDFGDKVKANCYVFDFAPDRALKMVTEFVKISARAGKVDDADITRLDALLKFCPVIAVEGSEMKQLNANKLLERIKDAQAERIVQNGFADNNLYSDRLLDLTAVDWQILNGAKKVVGTSKDPTKKIVINEQGLTDDEQTDGTKKKSARTPEQKEAARRAADRRNAIAILRQVSIRMPLLIYGADVPLNEKITAKRFAEIVDDDSWVEFMPAGFTRKMFTDLIPYYDPINFVNAAKKVRERAKAADKLKPTERVKKIAELFATFKNPDKETVLTPWRVVNLHMTETFGGWNFFADNPPQFVPTEIFRPDKKILEINSKTGLYPLFVAYSIYRARLGEVSEDKTTLDELRRLWDETVDENVFVICKTPMAKTITRRTLLGYRTGTVNAEFYGELITELKNIPSRFINRITEKNFWHKGAGKMFFDAVVGNPPYQNAAAGDSIRMLPVYNLFMENSFKLADKVSLIHPARWLFNAGATPQEFNERMLNDPHLKVVRYEADGTKFFPTSDIKGGVAITLRDANKNFGAIGTFIPWDEFRSTYQKVVGDNLNFESLSKIVFTPIVYRLSEKFFTERRDLIHKLQKADGSILRTNIFERLPEIFLDDAPADGYEYLKIHGLTKMQRVYKWIRRDYVNAPAPLNKWKVLLPTANGTGEFGETLSKPFVVPPLVVNTETFITVGAFDTEAEADACLKYIKTKFARAMLGILKVTQHATPDKWAKVPLQDFSSASDIDWTKPVAQIDEQLYRKYGLTEDEINFIESHVKAME